jgi:hypothetical protein
MTIQSGERSILPFGVAEIDSAGFCRDRLEKRYFCEIENARDWSQAPVCRQRRTCGFFYSSIEGLFVGTFLEKIYLDAVAILPFPRLRNSELAYLGRDQGVPVGLR